MKRYDFWKLSLLNIFAAPARSVLTVLGMAIGIGAILAVITLGDAGRAQVKSEMARLGIDRVWLTASEGQTLRHGDAQLLSSALDASATEQVYAPVEARAGRSEESCVLVGCSREYMDMMGTSVLRGRDRYAAECVHDIFAYHHKPEMKCTLESVGVNGEFQGDFTAGRVVNPGHDIECSWFLMEEANRTGDAALHKKAEDVFNFAIEAGWDKEYGGLLYFIDCKGLPPEAYEHDMKLWWPHNEILIASLMAYRDTKDEKYLEWFFKTAEYCKTCFADDVCGEWYGYLRRDGKPTEPPCKGSTFKGPFHVPRSLIMADVLLGDILEG